MVVQRACQRQLTCFHRLVHQFRIHRLVVLTIEYIVDYLNRRAITMVACYCMCDIFMVSEYHLVFFYFYVFCGRLCAVYIKHTAKIALC